MEADCYPLLLLVGSICLSGVVHGSGTVSVKLENYMNPGGKTAAGRCCDRGFLTCSSRCDHIFNVCLNDPATGFDASSCSVGQIHTEVLKDQNDIQFTDKIGGAENPFKIKFESWAPAINLKVTVEDYDEALNNTELVDEFQRSLSITPSVTYEEVVLQSRTMLTLKILVSCDKNYYGPGCTFCKPSSGTERDNDCGSDGEKICLEGERCEVRATPFACASNPCHGEALCKDVGASFICECPVELTGKLCETQIPHICDKKPCKIGEKCMRMNQTFGCFYDGKIGSGSRSYKLTGATSTSGSVILTVLALTVLSMVK